MSLVQARVGFPLGLAGRDYMSSDAVEMEKLEIRDTSCFSLTQRETE